MLRRLFSTGAVARFGSLRTFSATPRRLNLDYEAFSVATIRKPAPAFEGNAVINGKIQKISSNDYRGQWVVLLFYPLDFTFVCPTELTSFSDRASEFEALKAKVIGISVDSAHSHLAWVNTPRKKGGIGEMNIPLLSDIHKDIARDYGVLIDDEGIALRGLFIIDPDGVLRHSTVNDLPVGRNVDEVLRVLQGFQYAREHDGEVVPCNWKPGKATMKVEEAAKYFESNSN